MYSGFISPKRTLPAVGVHQRFDGRAYRLVAPYCTGDGNVAGSFPTLRQIKHFEGLGGPDGIKAKSPGRHDPNHLYDPDSETGELLELIDSHYRGLVVALQRQDQVRAAFEAAWLAHYICDGLTPAHHVPLDVQVAWQTGTGARRRPGRSGRSRQPGRSPSHFKHAVIVRGDTPIDSLKRSWALWGGKGLLMHFNFEIGVATALVGYRIPGRLNHAQLAQARSIGPLAYFKQAARSIAALQMYERFYATGWDGELARLVRTQLAPQTVQTIAALWLLAYLEAGFELARTAMATASVGTAVRPQ